MDLLFLQLQSNLADFLRGVACKVRDTFWKLVFINPIRINL